MNLTVRSTLAIALFAVACLFAASANAQVDVTAPGDPIVLVNGTNDGDANAGAPPAAEGVEHSIDNLTSKYLNFLDLGSGFTVTPAMGKTLVTGIRLYTANDAPERDPASFVLEGSNAGAAGPFSPIFSASLALPTTRNPSGQPLSLALANQLVTFANTTGYTSYRVTFPTLRDAALANSMQIGEVELLGVPVPEPSTIVLAGVAFVGLVGYRLRRR